MRYDTHRTVHVLPAGATPLNRNLPAVCLHLSHFAEQNTFIVHYAFFVVANVELLENILRFLFTFL